MLNAAALVATLLYLIAAVHIARRIRAGRAGERAFFLGAGTLAVLLHGAHVLDTLTVEGGIALGLLNAASLVGLLVAVVAILTSLVRPVAAVSAGAFPLAATLLLLSMLFADHYTPRRFGSGVGVHIVLSLLAYAVLAMATVHASLLAVQNRLFRDHRIGGLLRALPPIQTMEAILFELVAAGFVLLSLAILAGLLYVDDFFAQHLIHKTILTIAGWVALAVLLTGHRLAGWRGRTAVRWTVAAFVLLVVAFFGSKFVLEVVLGRS